MVGRGTVGRRLESEGAEVKVEASGERRDRNEQILLNVVGQEVRDRTDQSLYHTVLLTLGKRDASLTANLPRQGTLRLPDGSQQSVSAETSICDLFDRPTISRRLLIMGPAGIGKTTALMELAAELLQRAIHDPEQPLPVLFHLSSWPVEQHSFEDWLRVESQLKYGVSKRLSHQWLEASLLLPLLDGLDELLPDHQSTVVQQLNIWLEDDSRPLVVCCQCEQDNPAAVSLAVNGTLALAPLSPDQLEQYLTSLRLDRLWMRWQQWPEWLDLMQVPLWLNLGILTRETLDFTDWASSNNAQTWQNALLDAFITQQLNHPLASHTGAGRSHPTAQQTRRWLGWLAKHINVQSEYEFWIENMQPTLLGNRQQMIQYSILGGLIFGLIGGLIFGLFVNPGSGLFVTSVIVSLFILRRGNDAIDTIDTRPTRTSLMKFIFVRQVNYLLFFPFLIALIIISSAQGSVSIIFVICALFLGILITLVIRLMIALPSWLMGGLVFRVNRFFEADISIRTKPNQGFHEMLRYMLRSSAMFVPVLLLIKITPLFWPGNLAGLMPLEVTSLMQAFGIVSAIALWATLFDTALACAQHMALRLVLFQAKVMPWNYARFLNHCCDLNLLQRVGGRYRFTHRLVQERFASMP